MTLDIPSFLLGLSYSALFCAIVIACKIRDTARNEAFAQAMVRRDILRYACRRQFRFTLTKKGNAA